MKRINFMEHNRWWGILRLTFGDILFLIEDFLQMVNEMWSIYIYNGNIYLWRINSKRQNKNWLKKNIEYLLIISFWFVLLNIWSVKSDSRLLVT